MKSELADVVNIYELRHKSRWFGDGISACLAEVEAKEAEGDLASHSINWDKLLGLVVALVVVGLSWTALGIVVLRFMK